MEKIINYTSTIISVFGGLIEELRLEISYPNDTSIQLSNDKVEIIAWVERYERRVNFSFGDPSTREVYSSLEVYNAKGRPLIEPAKTGDSVTDNIIWHERFFRRYMLKELQFGNLNFRCK